MLTLYGQERSTETTTTASTADASDGRDETPQPETVVRDIHEMTPTTELPRPQQRGGGGGSLSPSRSVNFSDGVSSAGENFTTVSREFNALVIAGSSMDNNNGTNQSGGGHRDVVRDERNELTRIGEYEDGVNDHDQVPEEETNPWAIVPDGYNHRDGSENIVVPSSRGQNRMVTTASVQSVKREEVEAKITAWQTAKVAKVNNRFKRQDAVINGWLNEQVHKANSWMKKIERKLEERRAKAMEKTQNKVAKAQRKAEERRATAEAKRGTEIARVLEVANLMRAVERPPAKRSFLSFS